MSSKSFEQTLKSLNAEQRRAVEAIDGPMLVIAGPGTGKTQLLSTRVANILSETDSTPANILCLTFTDNAARTMRERLVDIIGRPAYHVSIHTFHSFGVEVINRYSDHFRQRQLLQQVDDLGRYELLREIFDHLPHRNPLSAKVGDSFVFLNDTLEAISWFKQNAMSPKDLHKILLENKGTIDALANGLSDAFIDPPASKALPLYKKLLKEIQKLTDDPGVLGFPSFAAECATELAAAIEKTDDSSRYAPAITVWRNAWCQKDANNLYVFKDSGRNYRKMQALANIYQELLDSMANQGLYDFDDMVMEAVQTIENDKELRYNLQEQYQYVLVDEFQDTNKAQLRLLTALGDNPVNEGRPNIMAVGDDDQAIYAFQGAQVSNMAAFLKHFSADTISLTENYRSDAAILKTAETIAEQISDRLQLTATTKTKSLQANKKYAAAALDFQIFSSELAQYSWIADEIKRLIEAGTAPEEIAVLAPRHRYLERLMPYLGEKHIPVVYERRENILEAPIIVQLASMAKLVSVLAEGRQDDSDRLFGLVLGYEFWNISESSLINLSLECYKKNCHWLEVLVKHKDERLRGITQWFLELSKLSQLAPMEYMLDKLVGETRGGLDGEFDPIELPVKRSLKFTSPLREYYFGQDRFEQSTESYLVLLGQLSTLRRHLRQWKPNLDLRINDLTEFIELNLAAGIKITDTNPHTQATSAVQVMTAHKAKGLEFDAVFLINAQDEVWGPTARSRSSRLKLPHNLPIAPAGDSDDDKLRLLFVSLTRARHTLRICGYSRDLENRPSPPLSFLDDVMELAPKFVEKPASVEAVEILSTDWSYRFRQAIAEKPELMSPILRDYKLSVTHLNNFIDVAGAGPNYFLVHNLLRFPEAMSPSAAYGDSVHQTIKWLFGELRAKGSLPGIEQIQEYFSDMLVRKHLPETDRKRLDKRGRDALKKYLSQRSGIFNGADLVERGFNNDGVIIGEAHLSGKVDLIHFGTNDRVEVLDFKTGKPSDSWQGKDEFEKIKLYKYRQQLLFYKLLVENSASYHKRLIVNRGQLEFIEANENDMLSPSLDLVYEQSELANFIKLIKAVWSHIMLLDFPDIKPYPRTLAGIQQFEKDLIK